jgi:hypothetical protein
MCRMYTTFDELADEHGVYKVDTIGDGEQLRFGFGCYEHFFGYAHCEHTTTNDDENGVRLVEKYS